LERVGNKLEVVKSEYEIAVTALKGLSHGG
jgi:hypothetical protein